MPQCALKCAMEANSLLLQSEIKYPPIFKIGGCFTSYCFQIVLMRRFSTKLLMCAIQYDQTATSTFKIDRLVACQPPVARVSIRCLGNMATVSEEVQLHPSDHTEDSLEPARPRRLQGSVRGPGKGRGRGVRRGKARGAREGTERAPLEDFQDYSGSPLTRIHARDSAFSNHSLKEL